MPRSLRRRAVEQGEALLVADVLGDSAQSVVELGLSGALVAPLHVRDYTVGVLLLGGEAFSESELEVFAGIAHLVAALVENARTVRALADSEGRLRAEAERLRERIAPADGLIGQSMAMREVLEQVDAVAQSDTTVLLLGETGTGKELLAQAIHRRSRRADGAILTVNMGALAQGTLESELFGHVKGAFTGAVSDRAGVFEAADGGTVFLDEIGDLPPQLQVKMLRVLQSGDVRKVGSDRSRKVDVRVIAATSRDLETMMGRSRFREDLYYRLMVVPMYLPPLREYPGSIPSMVKQFVRDANITYGRSIVGVTDEVMDALRRHSFPGNVRELRNIVEQGVLMTEGSHIGLRDAPPYLRGEVPAPPMPGSLSEISHAGVPVPIQRIAAPTPAPGPPPTDDAASVVDGSRWDYKALKEEVLGRFEARYLDALLATTDGNVTKAAELAGVHRVNLHRMLKKRDADRS